MKKYLIEKLKVLRQLFIINNKTKITPNYLQIGQKFIGKLKNEYQDKIITITKRMCDDNEDTLYFLHYNGFEEVNIKPLYK